mmetsp:Transcript_21121/g.25963  ORF Transcript_21121/g.25963 Transcript_21121/m.25963 type:complete len:1284 (-) Transcript_21121:373-4224(-)
MIMTISKASKASNSNSNHNNNNSIPIPAIKVPLVEIACYNNAATDSTTDSTTDIPPPLKEASQQLVHALQTSGFLLVKSPLLSSELQLEALEAANSYLDVKVKDKEEDKSQYEHVISHPTDPKVYAMLHYQDINSDDELSHTSNSKNHHTSSSSSTSTSSSSSSKSDNENTEVGGGGGGVSEKRIEKVIVPISKSDRPLLWSKIICSKVLEDVQSSSLVDSFIAWDTTIFDYASLVNGTEIYDLNPSFVQKILNEVNVLSYRIVSVEEGEEEKNDIDNLEKAKRDLCSLLVFYYRRYSQPVRKIHNFTSILKPSSMPTSGTDETKNAKDEVKGEDENMSSEDEKTKEEVQNQETESKNDGREQNDSAPADENTNNVQSDDTTVTTTTTQIETPTQMTVEWKPLLGPIAATLLSANIPIEVASVMLTKIITSTLPLISLTESERLTAVRSLHQQLYFLICYHLPLLVLHLDRYAPGWHWPKCVGADNESDNNGDGNDNDDRNTVDAENSPTKKGRNLEANGTVPITWFASFLAGEGTSDTLDQGKLLTLWDILLSCDDSSLRFFLVLALLEKHSDSLLMLRGNDLVTELIAVMSFKSAPKIEDDFMGEHSGRISGSKMTPLDDEPSYMMSWYNDAKTLRDSTPMSVLYDLCKAEDKAVKHIWTMRSKAAMEKMKARLEIEAETHRFDVAKKNAAQLEEKSHKYYKNRLEKFYDRHCPEKKQNIDQIMINYKDNLQELDKKLVAKYGAGFLPLISVFNPNIQNQTNKFISTIGQGFEAKKKNIVASRAEEKAKMLEKDMIEPGAYQVSIKVSASEVLPFVCGSKTATMSQNSREALKYYLVDSRPKESVKVQGGFPTAVSLSPEDLMDPESFEEKVDMFESLRGAVHICVMGEGFSSFPTLYDHPLSESEERLLENDESRTNMCALFFIKKGFPFVSTLEGGFAAAHTWLARDSKTLTLPKVLVDYDDKVSLFADLERSYQEQKEFSSASTRRKTTLALQRLIDNSMTRLTIIENRIEERVDAIQKESQVRKDTEAAPIITEEGEAEVKKASMKMQPITLFKNRSKDEKSSNASEKEEKNTQEEAGSGERKLNFPRGFGGFRKNDSSTTKNDTADLKKEESTEDETKNKDLKVGLNRAMSGFRNMRAARSKKEKDEKKDQSQAFDFGKVAFAQRNKNPFGWKSKQTKEDDALEREIEASLQKPDDTDTSTVTTTGSSTPDKQKKEKQKEDNGNASTRNFNANSIKDSFKKIPFNKFSNTIASKRQNRDNTAPITREEESLFFESD